MKNSNFFYIICFLSFPLYVIISNGLYIINRFIHGHFSLDSIVLLVKGNICGSQGPDKSAGLFLFIFFLLKISLLLFFLVKSRIPFFVFIKQLIIIYFALDMIVLSVFLYENRIEGEIFSYFFSAAPLFAASKVYLGSYLIIPLTTSITGLFLMIKQVKKYSQFFYGYLFMILSVLVSFIILKSVF